MRLPSSVSNISGISTRFALLIELSKLLVLRRSYLILVRMKEPLLWNRIVLFFSSAFLYSLLSFSVHGFYLENFIHLAFSLVVVCFCKVSIFLCR